MGLQGYSGYGNYKHFVKNGQSIINTRSNIITFFLMQSLKNIILRVNVLIAEKLIV